MALGITSESISGGDLSWLGSRHGVAEARTGTLKASAFTAEDGVVRSGTPVARGTDGLYVPYTGAEGTVVAGFVINDVVVDVDEVVAILDHGRIVTANLPVDFTVPAETGAFIYL